MECRGAGPPELKAQHAVCKGRSLGQCRPRTAVQSHPLQRQEHPGGQTKAGDQEEQLQSEGGLPLERSLCQAAEGVADCGGYDEWVRGGRVGA